MNSCDRFSISEVNSTGRPPNQLETLVLNFHKRPWAHFSQAFGICPPFEIQVWRISCHIFAVSTGLLGSPREAPGGRCPLTNWAVNFPSIFQHHWPNLKHWPFWLAIYTRSLVFINPHFPPPPIFFSQWLHVHDFEWPCAPVMERPTVSHCHGVSPLWFFFPTSTIQSVLMCGSCRLTGMCSSALTCHLDHALAFYLVSWLPFMCPLCHSPPNPGVKPLNTFINL